MFPQEGETVPKLRFKGFEGEWEKERLSNLLTVNSGRDYKHLSEGNIPVYGTGGYMLSVNKSLSDIDAIGIGRKGTIDKPQLLKAPFWTVDTLFYMIPKLGNDLLFLYAICEIMDWKGLDESTGVPSLSKQNIENIVLLKPATLNEQRAIASYFTTLDRQITLQSQRLEKLKQIKAACLDKMFV
ncbi:MAG: restriction endonuclease subunit S, partial [Bacteroidaceae bacterium]